MKSILVIIVGLNILVHQGWSQDRYFTKTGSISFYSHAPIEDIRAINQQVASMLDIKTGDILFAVLIRSFVFRKAMMQEHFNENYMESEIYPRSTFEGRIININEIDLSVPGNYTVNITGDLTIKDQSNPIETTGTLSVQSDKRIKGDSKFTIQVKDYGIAIPRILRRKIAENIEITCELMYEPYDQ